MTPLAIRWRQSEPVGATSLPCQQGSQLWLENLSGNNLSIAATVGSQTSSDLPQTATAPTPLINTADGSVGAVRLSVNGTSGTAFNRIERSWIDRPEDVQLGIVVSQSRRHKAPLTGSNNVIAVGRIPDAGAPEAGGVLVPAPDIDISMFLEDGMTESNTDIDLVFVGATAAGAGALPPGQYRVDGLSIDEASWVLDSIIANTIGRTGNEAGGISAFGRGFARRCS